MAEKFRINMKGKHWAHPEMESPRVFSPEKNIDEINKPDLMRSKIFGDA
ncbi:MAG TPA: hypothetical protein VKK79_09025 [Candidatus Lokiarchaeia archaeon]|nr:hypothetical protein [Candidatus Lokiarchaeia archaeon]